MYLNCDGYDFIDFFDKRHGIEQLIDVFQNLDRVNLVI